MKRRIRSCALATLLLALGAGTATVPAWAEKPEWAGKGQGHKKDKDQDRRAQHDGKEQERREARVGGYFRDRDRDVVRVYYEDRYDGGRKGCPPGLAKKNNGCMPPGQAKKYRVGQPLPAGVTVYPVPRPVLVQLPPAPAGHKYVRVAADILLIAIGTSMVVDAMQDLARL